MRLQNLAIAEVHMYSTGQAGVKAAHRSHDVDAFELVWAVLFEDGRVLYRVFVGSRRAVSVPRIRVPRRGRIRMIVGDFSLANYDVMGKNAAYRFVEAAGDGFVWNLEVGPGLGLAAVHFRQRLLGEIQRRCCRICLEVSASAIAFNRVAPLGNLPFELDFGQRDRLGQVNLYALAGGLDVADVHK